jgi:nitrogen fixation protein FixH
MNTFYTLFGGLVTVLALYAIGGALRGVPPMLRAILAGVLPLAAYFVYIVGRWPGLDVIAIHVSVFLATALVLFAMTQFRRRAVGRLHWAPKLLIAFFIGLVFLNATLLYISTKGLPEPIARWWLGSDGGAVYSGFSGVVPHGEGAAKAVSSELKESHRESQLGWQVEVTGLDNVSSRSLPIQLRVKDRTGLPVERVDAEISLMRPGSPTPALALPMVSGEAGVYLATLTLPAAGRWLLEIRLLRDGDLHFHSIQELAAP